MASACWALIALLAGATPRELPPLLADPARAEAELRASEQTDRALAPDAQLARAEAALLAGDPAAALRRIEPLQDELPPIRGRVLRLSIDARIALGEADPKRAQSDLLEPLTREPGWRVHAARQAHEVEERSERRKVAGFGAALYALTIAFLALAPHGASSGRRAR